jgi:hypothetical protein
MKTAKDEQEAWEIQHTFKGSHGWIQWKGTDVCIDLHCAKCQTGWHIDADFMYYVQCPECGTIYMVNGHIELIALETPPDANIVQFTGDKLTY